jgi:hypothetical protein
VRKIALNIRKWDVWEGKDRAQHIGLPETVKEVREGEGGVRGSVLKEKGGLRERIIGKPTVLTPGDNVDSRSEGYAVGIGSEFADSRGVVVSYKSHFDRKPSALAN